MSSSGRRALVLFAILALSIPIALGADPPFLAFKGGSISPFEDPMQWHEFVRTLVLHLIDRSGAATLDWYWSIGNENNFNTFWSGTRNEFWEIYDITVNAILRAFEQRGLDDKHVIVGGFEAAGLGGRGWLKDAMYYCSGAADAPSVTVEERNFVCIDPRFESDRAARVQAICDVHNDRGAPLDFVSIHEYELSERAVTDMTQVKDDALAMDPAKYAELKVDSYEPTPDWIPRTDPAASDIYRGNGYLPSWMADWVQRLVAQAEGDARYRHHESILTVWPFDYNGQGIKSWTGLMRVDRWRRLRGLARRAVDDEESWGEPREVTRVRLSKGAPGEVWLHRDSRAEEIGPGVQYEVFDGLVSDLCASGGFGGASCLDPQATKPPVAAGEDPPVRDARYHLVRAKNDCGAGTWGDRVVDPPPC